MSSICPICFETFNGKIKASPDVCNHIFCLQCLQTWTKTDNVCPIDRKKFRKIINLESSTTILIKPRKRRRKRAFYDISAYCEVCKDSSNGETLLLCDSCDLGYHCSCLNPPITAIPNDKWYCPECVAVELRLRTNKATNADKRYAKNRRNRKKGKVSKCRDKVFTRKLSIHYSETRLIQARPRPVSASPGNVSNCLIRKSSPEERNDSLSEQFESSHPLYDDQPGPSCSSASAREDTSHSPENEFEIGDSDFADSSSDDSELDDDISRVMDYFHQQEELNNTATFGEDGHLDFVDEDEFQDFDFDVFSSSENENKEPMTFDEQEDSKTFDIKLFPSVSSEPCTTATSTCENKPFDMESNDTFDFGDSDFNSSSSENCESKEGDAKVPGPNSTKYKIAEDGCYLATTETSQNEIHGVKQPEDYLQDKHNSTVNHFNSLTPKIDFIKGSKKTTDFTGTINDCNVTSSAKSHTAIDVIKFKESLIGKQNNSSVNDFNLSFPKRDFINSLNKAGDLNKTIDGCNILSSENSKGKVGDTKVPLENSFKYKFVKNSCYLAPFETSQNCVHGIKQPEDYLHATHNSSAINFNSITPKIDCMKSLKKTTNLTGIIDGCNTSSLAKSQIEINDVIKFKESLLAKQYSPSVNDFNSSSPTKDFLNSLKEAIEKNKKKQACNISSSENNQNGIHGMIESEESLHAKQNNQTVNDFNLSSPKRDFMNSLTKARDLNKTIDGCNISSSKNSKNQIGGVIESEVSLYAGQNHKINHLNSSSPKRNVIKTLKKTKDLKKVINGNVSCSENSKNGIDSMIESEESLHVKQKNPIVNDFYSSSTKQDFMNSLNKARDLKETTDVYNISSFENSENRIDGAIESEERLHAKKNNQIVNDFNSSSPKRHFKTSLSKARDLNNTIDGCYISCSENSENRIDSVIESEESLHVKQKNPIVNDFYSSSTKQDFMNSLNKARDLKETTDVYNISSFENSENRIDGAIESEERLHAKKNNQIVNDFNSSSPKRHFKTSLSKARDLNNTIDGCYISCSENSENRIDSVIESEESLHVKQKNPIVNDFYSSSTKQDFMNSLNKARDLKETTDVYNISSFENSENRIDGAIESEERLHAKKNNQIVNDFNSSSPKRHFKTSLSKARDLNNTIDGCYISCSENSENRIDSVIESEESLHVKQKNPIVNDFYSSSTKQDFMNSLNKARDLKETTDVYNISSFENSENRIDGAIESEERLHAKKNNQIVNDFNSSSPKRHFKTSLSKARDLNNTIDGCYISCSENSENRIDSVIESEESLHVKQKNPIVNDFYSSSTKQDFMNSLNKARDLKETTDVYNISSFENSENRIDGAIESEERLHAKRKNLTINDLNSSSPKRNVKKTSKKTKDLKKIIDGNVSCSENSQNGIDSVIESEESLHAKQKNQTVNIFYSSSSTKLDVMNSLNKAKDLNRTIEGCNISSENENRTDGVIKSEISLNVKQNNSTVNDFNSSPKRNFKKKAINHKRTLGDTIESLHAKHNNPNINPFSSSSEKEIVKSLIEKAKSKLNTLFTNFKDTSSKQKEENSTNKTVIIYNQQVKRKTFDNVKPDLVLNTTATSTFENDASDFNISALEIRGIEMDDGKAFNENLHLNEKNEDIDNCNPSSSENNESSDGCSSVNTAYSKGNKIVSSFKHTRDGCNSYNSSSSIESETMDDYISTKNLHRNKTIDDCNSPSSKNNEATDECYSSNILSSKNNESIGYCNFLHASSSKCSIDDCNFSNISPSKKRKHIDDYISAENLHHNKTKDNCNASSSKNNESTDECYSSNILEDKMLEDNESIDNCNNLNASSSKRSIDDCNSSNISPSKKRKHIDDYISAENLHHNKTKDNCNASSSKNNESTDECYSSNILSSKDNESIDNCNNFDAASSKRSIDHCNSSNISPSKKRKHIGDYISAENLHLNECNNAIDKCNISSSENCQNKMDAVKSKKHLHAKEQNQILNDIDSSSSASNKNVSVDKIKDGLCRKLQDNDDNSTSSMDYSFSDYHKAILLKLPLRLSFKRTPTKTSDNQGLTNDTSSSNATVDDISASICKIASVTSLQLDNKTASSSDGSLLSNTATIRTDQVSQTQNATNQNKQNEIDGSSDMTPSISIPITFSFIEEQNAFEPFQTKDTSFFNCTEGGNFIANPWSNFYSRQASNMARYTTTAAESLKHPNEEQVKIPIETSPTKKLIKNDYTLSMEKSGNLTIPSNASHLFGNRIFIKDMKQLSVRKDGALFLNWKNV